MEIRLSSNNNNCMHIFKVFKILKWTLQNFLSKLLKISFLDISNNLVIHERVRVGLTDNKYECTRCRLGYLVNIELQVLKPHKVICKRFFMNKPNLATIFRYIIQNYVWKTPSKTAKRFHLWSPCCRILMRW